MINTLLLTTDAANQQLSIWYSIGMLGIMVVLMVVMVFLPQRKQQKKDAEMRNNLEVGDGVTTIGGIVGRVASIKDDTFLLETGSDRVKIRMMKTAIASVEKLDLGGDNTASKSKKDKKEEKKEEEKTES